MIACVGILHAIFDLVEEDFDGEIDIVCRVHLNIVQAEVIATDLSVCGEEMGEKGFGCYIGIPNVAIFQRAREHIIDRTKKLLFECLIHVVKFVEDSGFTFVRVGNSTDLCLGAYCRNDGGWSGVGRWDKRDEGQGIVYGVGDAEP